MKLRILLWGSIFLLTLSCSKDFDDLPVGKKILGKWDWIESYGGFSGNVHYTPANTGESRQLIFLRNQTVYMITNSDTVYSTDYFTSRENSILLHEELDFLTINYRYYLPDTTICLPMRYMIRKINDTLELDEDVYDGFGHRYVRMAE